MVESVTITMFKRWNCWGYVKWSWHMQVSWHLNPLPRPSYLPPTLPTERTSFEEFLAAHNTRFFFSEMVRRAMKRLRTKVRIYCAVREPDGSTKTHISFYYISKEGKGQPIVFTPAERWN